MGLAVLPKYAVLSCMLGTLQSTLNTTLEHVDSIRDDAVLRTSKALLLLLVDFTLYLLCWIPVYSFRLRFCCWVTLVELVYSCMAEMHIYVKHRRIGMKNILDLGVEYFFFVRAL